MPVKALRSRFWNVASSVFLLSVALLMAGFAWRGVRAAGTGPGSVLLAAGGAVLLAGAFRLLFLGVFARPDHLMVRELVRTTRVPWKSIEGVRLISREVETFGSTPTIATPMPELLYRRADGQTKRLAIASLGARRTTVAQRNVDALVALIDSRGR